MYNNNVVFEFIKKKKTIITKNKNCMTKVKKNIEIRNSQ